MAKGGSKKELVSSKEFTYNFAIPNEYGDSSKPWPHTTILLYKYSSNATKKKTTEDTWKKIQNESGGDHAEVKMIKKLKKIQKELKKKSNGIHSIEVIQSYSPCSKCSKKLCDLMVDLNKDINKSKSDTSDSSLDIIESKSDTSDASLDMSALIIDEKDKKDRLNKKDEKEAKINFKITFSNFYKHWDMEGLKDLLVNEIELDILTGDKWKHFFDVVGLARKTKLPEGRKEREKKDIEFFQELSESIIISNDLDKK